MFQHSNKDGLADAVPQPLDPKALRTLRADALANGHCRPMNPGASHASSCAPQTVSPAVQARAWEPYLVFAPRALEKRGKSGIRSKRRLHCGSVGDRAARLYSMTGREPRPALNPMASANATAKHSGLRARCGLDGSLRINAGVDIHTSSAPKITNSARR